MQELALQLEIELGIISVTELLLTCLIKLAVTCISHNICDYCNALGFLKLQKIICFTLKRHTLKIKYALVLT